MALVAALTAQGAVISPADALARAGVSAQSPMLKSIGGQPRLVHTAYTEAGEEAVYGFDCGAPGEGFMLLSADDAAYPVLGYSHSGSLAADSLPPQLQWWLSEYASQIEWARTHNVGDNGLKMPRAKAGRTVIEPMIKTLWDQGAPYNDQCPLYGTERCWTGCVATTMAQIMNYFQYPAKGKGTISYTSESIQMRLAISRWSNFDWANMLNVYDDNQYNKAQADAVAYLMKTCGYAVKMDYGLDSSGALAMAVPYAMVKYFDYDPNLKYEIRACYTATEWDQMMYDNLKNVGPVAYGGGSLIGGGHSFICDGYDGEGYYHFNWGWTGMSDGYFSLDALNPYALGAGGGGGGGYNFTQDAVFGLQPPTGKPTETRVPTLVQHGSLYGTMASGKLKFQLVGESSGSWVNYNYETLACEFGCKIEKDGDASFAPRYYNVIEGAHDVAAGYGVSPEAADFSVDLANANLSDGTYKITFVIRHGSSGGEWIEVRPASGYYNYIRVKKSGREYEVIPEDFWLLDIDFADVSSGLYYGMAAKVAVIVRNDGPIEQTRGFAPAILDPETGTPLLLGESAYLTVKPGESVEYEWVTPMYQMQQYFQVTQDTPVIFTLFDESTYMMWSGDVWQQMVLHPNPGFPNITTARKPTIEGAEMIDGVLVAPDRRQVKISAEMLLSGNVFGYPLYAVVTESDGSTIVNYNGSTVFWSMADIYDFSTIVDCRECIPGRKYQVVMCYEYGGSLLPATTQNHMITFTVAGVAGVEDVTIDSSDSAPAEYYNLQGVRVAEPANGGVYIRRQGGITTKVIK